jgi:hypothetical protein
VRLRLCLTINQFVQCVFAAEARMLEFHDRPCTFSPGRTVSSSGDSGTAGSGAIPNSTVAAVTRTPASPVPTIAWELHSEPLIGGTGWPSPLHYRSSVIRKRISLRNEFLGGLTERDEQSAIADDTKSHTIVRTSCLHVHDCPRLTATIASDSLVGVKVYQHSHNLPPSSLKSCARQESD